MDQKLNLRNYIELLKNQEGGIEKIDQQESLQYGALIERQISYNRKEEYFWLIGEYLGNRMDCNEFRATFLKMQETDDSNTQLIEKDWKELSNFSIDSSLEKDAFSLLIHQIYNTSMIAIEFDPEEEDGISDDEFRDYMEKAFSEMQNYMDNE